MKRTLTAAFTLLAASASSYADIPVIDGTNLKESKQINENTQQILDMDQQIKDHTQKILSAVTGDRTSESGQLQQLAIGQGFNMGSAPDLGDVISGGVLSFTGMGQGAQDVVSKLINGLELVKSITGMLDGEKAPSFDKAYQTGVNVTATVMGLVDSTQGALKQRSSNYTQGASQIGTAKDLKGSIDQNSQIQVQNGLTIVEMTGVMNSAVTAVNQQNVDYIARQSALSKVTRPATWDFKE